MLSHVTVLKRWHKGEQGVKILGHGFWTKYDVIVVIATTCATTATQLVCGKFNAELCNSVETDASGGIEG